MPVKNSLRTRAIPATVAAALALLAACGNEGSSDGGATASPSIPAAEAHSATDLSDVCPSTVVVQTAWWPDTTSAGALYELLGEDREIDADRKRVTAPLIAGGKDTGVELELRAGGPAIGFRPTSAQMAVDKGIHLGIPQGFDEAIQNSAEQPTLAVMSLLAKNPQIIMWDPETYPQFDSIEDIGRTDTKVVYYPTPYMEYLTGHGILKDSQVEDSNEGSPARFVAAGGEIAQSGYVTEDPYIYEHDLPQWGKKVDYQLVYEAGYPDYGPPLLIRPDDKSDLTPCLKKLVPVVQEGILAFLQDPQPVIDLVIELRDAYKADAPFSEGVGAYSVEQMKKHELVADAGEPVGHFDTERVQELIDLTEPIFAKQQKPIKEGLTPADLVTNEFVDPEVLLGH